MNESSNKYISATPRYDESDHRNPYCISDVIADLTVQVARIANAMEFHMGMSDISLFPETRPGYMEEK